MFPVTPDASSEPPAASTSFCSVEDSRLRSLAPESSSQLSCSLPPPDAAPIFYARPWRNVILWTALSLALGLEIRGEIIRGVPCIKRFHQLFCPTAGNSYPMLRVFENKVLRKIFGAKLGEVTGQWRKLHNTELHALYSSPDIIRNIKSRRLRWAGHVARMGESRNTYRVLVGRPEGKRPLGRPRRRWEDNIKMDLREVGYGDREWINLAQDRDQWRAYVRAAMNLRVP
ncbi:hypothetical protein ANN_15732 [Periplaneta americana]|uniref:Uncharacterized protein n=1 Tax=Periplaneta americana TaxID=6978 RepID=A0ABQ8SH24_PERAM|nr:hypothetical protein ANN_15732 [Periplaneta americana]